VRFPCVHAAATTPVQRLGVVFARLTQPCQPSPVPRPDRPAHRPFRGLLSVHSRCGLHTRTVTVCRDRYPKASDTSSPPCLLRLLPAGANRRVGLAPTGKAPPCHGARGRRTPPFSPSSESDPKLSSAVLDLNGSEGEGFRIPARRDLSSGTEGRRPKAQINGHLPTFECEVVHICRKSAGI